MVNLTLFEARRRIPIPDEYSELLGKKILITGAAGFIGGALFKRLFDYGLDVVGTVLFEDEARQLRELGYSVEVLDLSSNDCWETIFENIDVVFNIAALFQEIEHGEAMYRKVNIDGTLKLIQTAANTHVKRFIHCSTVGVYGHVTDIPSSETSPFNPMDEYHRSKLEGETAILDFARTLPSDGMIVTVNRPAMVYGPGDMRMLKLFKSILTKKFVMIGSGETLAHLGYIDDQIDSFLLCSVKPRENVHLECFNIASENYITLNELAGLIAQSGDVTLPRVKIPVLPVWLAGYLCEKICLPLGLKPPIFRRRVGFFTHNRAFDISKAKRLIDFSPRISYYQGVKSTVEWYRKHDFV